MARAVESAAWDLARVWHSGRRGGGGGACGGGAGETICDVAEADEEAAGGAPANGWTPLSRVAAFFDWSLGITEPFALSPQAAAHGPCGPWRTYRECVHTAVVQRVVGLAVRAPRHLLAFAPRLEAEYATLDVGASWMATVEEQEVMLVACDADSRGSGGGGGGVCLLYTSPSPRDS